VRGETARRKAVIPKVVPATLVPSSPTLPHFSCTLNLTPLSPSIQETATAIFLSLYIPSSTFFYLPDILATSNSVWPFPAALTAPALAVLSQQRREVALLDLGRKYYSEAIAEINKSLEDRNNVVLDTTLAAVLLLGLFESIAFTGRKSPTEWTTHINGAAALLELRGPEQFATPTGRALFQHTSASICTSSALRKVPVPPVVSALEAQMPADSAEPVYLGPVLKCMAEIRAGMKPGGIYCEDPSSLARRAAEIDSKMIHLMDHMARVWPPKMVPAPASSLGYRGWGHSYTTHQVAHRWNAMRMIRLFLNEWAHAADVAIRKLEISAPEQKSRISRDTAAVNTENMATDILTSVPHFLDTASRRDSGFPSMSARHLLWPLSAIASCNVCSTPARLHAREILQIIGQQTTFSQATEAADMVLEEHDVEDW